MNHKRVTFLIGKAREHAAETRYAASKAKTQREAVRLSRAADAFGKAAALLMAGR